MSQRPGVGLSMGLVVVFYGIMAVIGLGLYGLVFGEVSSIWRWRDPFDTPPALDAALGCGFGLLVVGLSAWMDRRYAWSRRLSRAFAQILGPISTGQALVMAATSGVAEEILFRGFLQRALHDALLDGTTVGMITSIVVSSAVFAALHIGPDRRVFLPWTIMAFVLSLCLGALYLATGELVAPILAHFTINFFNFLALNGVEEDPPPHAAPDDEERER